jgi:hypothetical protein
MWKEEEILFTEFRNIAECTAFNQLGPEKLDTIFLMLHMCMQEIMLCGECNGYKIDHMNKKKLR